MEDIAAKSRDFEAKYEKAKWATALEKAHKPAIARAEEQLKGHYKFLEWKPDRLVRDGVVFLVLDTGPDPAPDNWPHAIVVENGVASRLMHADHFYWRTDSARELADRWANSYKIADGDYRVISVERLDEPRKLDAVTENVQTGKRYRFRMLDLNDNDFINFTIDPID
jgi:hypothetical protein